MKEEELARNNMTQETSFERKDLEDLKKMLEQIKTSIEEIHSDKEILAGKEIFPLLDKANVGYIFPITNKIESGIDRLTSVFVSISD